MRTVAQCGALHRREAAKGQNARALLSVCVGMVMLGLLTTAAMEAQQTGSESSGLVGDAALKVWVFRGYESQLNRWEAAYAASHPGAHFENTAHGAAAVMAGVYDGVADLALMGREIWPVETMAYRWVYQQQPFGVVVATAGLSAPGQAFTPVVMVNRANPLAAISLSQLDAIFGSEHRAAPANIRTWGELGLTGEWASRPIHAYGFGGEDALGVYFRHDVLRSDFKPNPDSHLLSDSEGSSAAKRIAEAVAADPDAIGYTSMEWRGDARVLPVIKGSGAPVAPDAASLSGGTYPLTRSAWLYFRRSPGKPLDPRVDSFVRFILSENGQKLVKGDDSLLPLTRAQADAQETRLDRPMTSVTTEDKDQ